MPGMTNCLVSKSQEKYSFATNVLSTSSANYTFDETTVIAQIRAGLQQLAAGCGAKFYGIVKTNNNFNWVEYTAETLPIKITNQNDRLEIAFGTTVDSIITIGSYNGFALCKCEFTKKFTRVDVLLLGKGEGSTNEVYLTIIGGDTLVVGSYQVETAPYIGLSYTD